MATTTVIKDIFVGDVGTHFQCEIINLVNSEPEAPLDISTAEEMLVVFIKPDGTEKEFTGTFVSDGTDGLLEYITQPTVQGELADLDTDGAWYFYGWVKYPDGGQRRTSAQQFKVYPGRQSELPVVP